MARITQQKMIEIINRLKSSVFGFKKNLNKKNSNSIDDELEVIQRSTRTTVKYLIPLHNALRMKWKWYYNWHLKPYANKLHISGATLASVTAAVLVLAVMFSTLVPQTKASNYSKTWSTTDDFNTGTNSNIDTAGNEAKLASTTTDFNEGFTSTTNKDAASDANWDTSLHKLNLPGDPTSGVATDLQVKWKETVGANESIRTGYDSINHFIYLGGGSGSFAAYDPSNGTLINLTSKISADWSIGSFSGLTFDSTNGKIYLWGSSGRFGAFTGGSDPANGTWVYLRSKILSDFSGGIDSCTFDSTNGKIYLGGSNSSNKFGVFTGGADPANGNYVSLTTVIQNDILSSDNVRSLVFDSTNGKIYIGAGNAKFGVFTGGSDPANGTWINLSSKVTGWSTDSFYSLGFDSTNGYVYLGGWSKHFASFIGGADPANGTFTNLTSKLTSWDTYGIKSMSFDTVNSKLYISGGYDGSGGPFFASFSGGSNPSTGTYVSLNSKLSSEFTTPMSIPYLSFDSTNGKVILSGKYSTFAFFQGGSNPADGTYTYLGLDIASGFQGFSIVSSAYDSANGYLYVGGAGGRFMAYKLSDSTAINLTSKISSYWSTNEISAMVYDFEHGYIYLGGVNRKGGAFSCVSDPNNGVWTSITWGDWVYGLEYDSTHDLIYVGGSANYLAVFSGVSNPATGTLTSVKSKLTGIWPNGSSIFSLKHDTVHDLIYLSGENSGFGVFSGGSDPVNGSFTYLNSKISAQFGTSANYIRGLAYDPANDKVYIGGSSGKFAIFNGGADPANGTTTYLHTQLSSPDFDGGSYWSNSSFYALTYASGKIYLAGTSGRFGVLNTAADPSTITSWYYLNSSISSIIGTGTIYTLTYVPDAATVYLGADSGKFISFLQGYMTNKSGISTTLDSTSQNIYKATLTATETKPANTTITYYLSNDGGTHWNAVTSGSEYTFSTATSDLRWKAYLQTSDAATTPEITGITVSYKYFNSNTGTMSLVYDAEQTVVPVWLSWTASTPTNTTLTFKIRTASTQDGLTSATWSDTKNAADTPVNLKTLNVGGATGVPENRWSEVYASFSTTDGLNTPVLSDVTEQYVINAVPEIENVSAHQRTDGSKIVDISYAIKDSDAHTNPYNQDQVSVSLQYSIDSGSGWSNCTTATGTGLKNVNEGSFTSYTASWDIATDLTDSYYNNTVLIKLVVNDNEQAHNLATLTTSLFSIDSKNPVTPVFTISGGANASGKVNLTGIGATDDTTLTQMIVTLDPSYPESAWQAYSATLNDFSADSGDTIYVKVKDSFGNLSTGVSHKVPLTVQNVVLSDLSNAAAGDYRLAIGWSALTNENEVNGYRIFRSADSGAYTLFSSINDRSVNGAIDSSVSPSHSYKYQVFAAGSGNNIGMASNTVSGQPAFVPTVSGVSVQSTGYDRAAITWTTDVPCDSFVEFGADTSYGAIQGSSSLATSHSFTVTGLNSETTFHFRVRSRDQKGTLAMSNDDTFTTAIDTSGKNDDLSKKPSKISNVSATDTNFSSTVILWQTSVVSLSELQYGTTTDYGKSIADSSANYTTQHTVKVTALEQGSAYHFRIKGTDLFGNTFVSDDYTFNTLSMPTVSNIEIKEISSMGAVVTWITNVDADSNVDFGESDLSSSQGSSEAVKNHSIKLTNLKPATGYRFRVRSRDAYGNLATSSESSFQTIVDTTAPVIKDMKSEVSILTDETGSSKAQAIISWSTDEPATSQVKYALGVAAGNDYPLSTTEDVNLTTSHIVIISNLQPSSTYHMKLVSKDSSGNIAASDDYTVLTLNQEKSLLQYIVQILEERFSWLRTLGLF